MNLAFVILGQPASKANRRRLVTMKDASGKPVARSIKSPEALEYERDALRQIPPKCRVRLDGPLVMTLRVFYASERSDLDESLILDVLQDRWDGVGEKRVLVQSGVYRNDRQVRERHVYHGIDAREPRTEIVIEPLVVAQSSLFGDLEPAPSAAALLLGKTDAEVEEARAIMQALGEWKAPSAKRASAAAAIAAAKDRQWADPLAPEPA